MRQATSKHDMLWAMDSSTRSISPHPPPLWASHILTQGTAACAGTMDMGTSWQWELARPCRASSGGWNVRWQSGNVDQGSGASRGEQKNYHVIPQTHSECTGQEWRADLNVTSMFPTASHIKSQHMEATQMATDNEMDTAMWPIHARATIPKSVVHALKWLDTKDIVLSETNQSQRTNSLGFATEDLEWVKVTETESKRTTRAGNRVFMFGSRSSPPGHRAMGP